MTMKGRHYIKRHLIKAEDTPDKIAGSSRKVTSLTALVQARNQDSASRRIVILGEAGSGKSTELFNEASQLYRSRDYDSVPVFISLNTYTGDNFKQYAEAKLGQDADSLLNYDKTKLIFFLDEFDQVLNKEYATRQIQTFVDLFREATFIISCRSNFYTNQFPEFDRYFLVPFDDSAVSELSRVELPISYRQFIGQLTAGIKEVTKVPFFLDYLIDLFKKNDSIPDSQTDVLEMVINNALSNDLSKLSEFDLPNRYPLASIKKDLQLISLILEILQRNFLDADELNAIIQNDFRSNVIKRLSLITKSCISGKEVFQFLHNNFNEYFAAKSLHDQDFEKVLDFFSVKAPLIRLNKENNVLHFLKYFNLEIYGLKVTDLLFYMVGKKKRIGINPSWANTLGFLIQLRSDRDLLNHLVKHEPEMALNIELSRLTEDDRYVIFKATCDDYFDKNIVIRSDVLLKLADIILMSDKRKSDIYNYLMKYATAGGYHNHRYNSLHLLCYVKGDYREQIIETMINRIRERNEDDNVRYICMLSLEELGANGKDIIDRIIEVSDTDSDYILAGIFYLLSHSPDLDKYIGVLTAGISKSRRDRTSNEVRLGDEKYYLMKCLEKISSPGALKSIISYLSQNPDLFQDYDIKRLMPSLIVNLIHAYALDGGVYNYGKELLISAEQGYSDELDEIGNFFISTNTAVVVFRDLLSQGFAKHYNALAAVFNEDTLSLLVEEYEKGNVSENDVWIYVRHIAFLNHSRYQEALSFLNAKTNNKFVPEPPIDHKALDKERLSRNVEIIFDKDEFIHELKTIFLISEKTALTYSDTVSLEHENLRQNRQKYNSFVIDIIQAIILKEKTREWSLDALIKEINTWNYDFFTFEHVFKLLYEGSDIQLTDDQIKFVKDFCQANLKRVDFKRALSVKREGNLTTSANGLAVRIWFCKRRLHFELPESVLLDMLSFDWIEQSGYCGIDYLLNELDSEKVKVRIIQNLQEGIQCAPVLINHVVYCLNNNLEGVLDYIYAAMNGEFIDNHDRKRILELLLNFHGGREYIKRYLNSNDNELYLKAAELLAGSEDAKEIIRRRLNESNVDIALTSAKLLIPDQDIKAIKFYINHIIKDKKRAEELHSPIGKIDNVDALEYLFELLLFYFTNLEELTKQHSFLHMEIMQAMKNIARRNYRNLRRVDHLLENFIKAHAKRWAFVVNLNQFRNEIESEYYANYKEVNNLQEAIEKAKPLFA
jgi:hypothetical protein